MSTIVTAARVPQRCTNATTRPSGESRGSVSSRPARTSSTEIGSTEIGSTEIASTGIGSTGTGSIGTARDYDATRAPKLA